MKLLNKLKYFIGFLICSLALIISVILFVNSNIDTRKGFLLMELCEVLFVANGIFIYQLAINKKNKLSLIKNRKVTKARFLYLYTIIGSILGLVYFIASFFIEGLPKFAALTPLYLIVGFVLYRFLVKNWKLIGLYISDMEQGRLLLFLNKSTHWTDDQKLKVVKWVYLRRRTIRKETHAKLTVKILDGKELTNLEKKLIRFKSVGCPQQMMLGFNEALLVYALIYAHQNIQVLDDELRDIMHLTDENILKFDLQAERKKAGGDKYDEYMKIGKRNSKK